MPRFLLVLAVSAIACTASSKPAAQQTTQDSTNAANTPQPAKPTTRSVTVLFVGTSLTAGLGLPQDQAYPALVQNLADSAGTPIHAINAGLSGETTAGALRRIDWVLKTPADIVVLENGANDALRGLSVDDAKSNIEAIIDHVKKAQPTAKIALVQMDAPPNLGATYDQAFDAIYPDVAKTRHVTLFPFLLNNVYGRPELNQDDGLHPNTTGEKIVAQNVWQALAPLVRTVESGRGH